MFNTKSVFVLVIRNSSSYSVFVHFKWSHPDSNRDQRFRKPAYYPLYYETRKIITNYELRITNYVFYSGSLKHADNNRTTN